jgi:hypothetical protein
MEPQLFVMSVGDKHYVSGTVYTPKGIRQYNGVLDEFEQIFTLFPTFATLVVCTHDEVCIRDHIDYFYYLTYRTKKGLMKMLSFMSHSFAQYLDYIPPDVISKMDLHTEGIYITIGGTDIYQNVGCEIIGSVPTVLTVTRDYIFINGLKVGERVESGYYVVCGEEFDLRNNLDGNIPYLLACYFLRYYKGTPTWSEVLRAWCGIKILSRM